MTATLRRGSKGVAVSHLQQYLTALGCYSGAIDGDFGPATELSVVSFQRMAGLYPDGVAGPKTDAALAVAPVGFGSSFSRGEAASLAIVPAPPRQSMSAIGLAALIAREGRKLTAYKDSVGVWTIGIGHTSGAGAPVPYAGLTITAAEADAIFARDIVKYEDTVRDAIKVPLADQQFDALGSLCYNIGQKGFAGSTLVKRINAGDTPTRIRAAILMWRKPAEILSRRTAEADQFATPYTTSLPKARSTDGRAISMVV